jgi:DNA-binding transcriptional MerR regulator
MLRHYDEIGLLSPERTKLGPGYRWYDVGQLPRLHRLQIEATLEQERARRGRQVI